jgi:protein involved in polysaccharide export with SLBB domain
MIRFPLHSRAVLLMLLLMPLASLTAQGSPPLRPGDGVRIVVYEDAALSGEFLVDDRGMLVLPRIGDWSVAGMSADSVRPKLLAALRSSLTSKGISVVPFRRVVVAGAVRNAGMYPVDASMTVGDAIILAGGPSDNARARVERRTADGDRRGVNAASNIWALGLERGEHLIVPSTGWLRRNWWQLTTFGMQVAIIALQLTR